MSKLSQSILKKIRTEQRTPVPSWLFRSRYALIWLLVIGSSVLTALFLGSLIGEVISIKWDLANRWPGHSFGLVRDFVTIFWVIGAVVALIGGILFFRRTKRGYRYRLIAIMMVLTLTSVVVGASLIATSIPGHLRAWHENLLPPVFDVARFQAPSDGRLVGEITDTRDSTTVHFEDVTGKTWELWVLDDPSTLPTGLVHIFGEPMGGNTFAALMIRPVPPHNFVQGLPPVLRIHQ